MTGLRIAPDLELPIEAVTETFAILAKRGKGKTNTAVVMAEEMIPTGMPVVVIDPVGVWWGLRSSADGKSAGLPVVIFGGDHGDVPLEPTAGELIADVLVDRRMSAVIDLSSMSKSASRRFMAPFIERLYHRNREAMHVIVDEADAFAPQRTQGEGARLLGAMEDLVRRGRARGIGVTLITQRPAVINKDVLTQAEVLIALGMTGPRDVAAIDEWVKLHADEDQAKQVKASLPSLPVGTAWVWSPGWLDILQRVQIRPRRTFDSSATPKPGERRVTPQNLAPIDLAELGSQITATVERAKADDPKALRAEIQRLTRQLELERSKPQPTPAVEYVEVPVLTADDVAQFQAHGALVTKNAAVLLDFLDIIDRRLTNLASRPQEGKQGKPTTRSSAPRANQTSSTTRRAPVAGSSAHREKDPSVAQETRPAATDGPDSDVRLGKTERSILSVLAQHGPRTHDQLALLTGYSRKASTIGVALGKLRKVGFVEPGQPITATSAGVDWLGDSYEALPSGQALIDYWRSKFGLTEQRVLDAVLDAYPHDTSQAEIAEATGYSPTASTIGVALGRLRKVGVIDRWRISDDFAAAADLGGVS